jgi:hypothetical protein
MPSGHLACSKPLRGFLFFSRRLDRGNSEVFLPTRRQGFGVINSHFELAKEHFQMVWCIKEMFDQQFFLEYFIWIFQ